MIEILSSKEIDLMREAGAKASATLKKVGKIIRPGLTTKQIDDMVMTDCLEQGCKPAPLGYRGADGSMPPYPAACCTSINEVVCHGIPSERALVDGDIINVDVTHIWQGYHGDTSATFMVGRPTERAFWLVSTCMFALSVGIQQVKPGARLGDIGAAIQEIAEKSGFSVVTAFVGHGIGRKFHAAPNVPHYGQRGTGTRLKPGMCFTIEPMINVGGHQIRVLDDGWTAVTADGSLSAQFEHTVLVTETSVEVLTQ